MIADVGYDYSGGKPPVNLSQKILLDRNREVNEDEDAITNDTIDLPDSSDIHR